MRRSKKDSELSSLIALADADGFFLFPKIQHINYTTKSRKGVKTLIENPKIGQEVWFAEACNQRIHSAKLIALDEVEVSTRKYLYTKIEMDDGCRLGWPLKSLYASKEELQKELAKKKGSKNND